MYSGRWLPARPLSDCMCDPNHPLFSDATSNVHCYANPPGTMRRPRLQPANINPDVGQTFFFLPDFVNGVLHHYHYDVPLIWVSTPGVHNVSLDIVFEDQYQVSTTFWVPVSIHFNYPLCRNLLISMGSQLLYKHGCLPI